MNNERQPESTWAAALLKVEQEEKKLTDSMPDPEKDQKLKAALTRLQTEIHQSQNKN